MTFLLCNHTTHTQLMSSSYHRYQQDKTVLSCLVGIHGVNWIGDKSRLSATENFETVLSSYRNAVWTVPVSNSHATWLSIVTSYWKTGSRLVPNCVHIADETGQNCSVSNLLRTTENCLRLSPTQFTPPTRQDKTRQSCQCRRCEVGINHS